MSPTAPLATIGHRSHDVPMTESVRNTVYYSGRVQGVGFRRSVARVAQAYDILGTVRNLPDGRVHLVAEAAPGRLRQFLDDVADVMTGYIESTDVSEGMATGEFERFTVRLS